MGHPNNLPNPKRDRSTMTGRSGWYPYYAGFSAGFAQCALELLPEGPQSTVLDPWNGSGTTTAVTAGKGFKGFGFDLNPVMLIVARARLLNKRERFSLLPLAELISTWNICTPQIDDDDPLRVWFTEGAVTCLRTIEARLQKALMGLPQRIAMESYMEHGTFSDIAAFFYVGLFRTVRTLLGSFQSSNPTWLKHPISASRKLRTSENSIVTTFLAQIASMERALNFDELEKDAQVTIGVAPSQSIPIPTSTIDFVLSSPPYCTRIDYASATKAELAVLGVKEASFQALRRKLMGTPTVPHTTPDLMKEWGNTCGTFLESVKTHSSKASKTYYYKSHSQYFAGAYESMREVCRCLKPAGRACLVVQDSYYKELHNDLAAIYSEMGQELGLKIDARRDFTSSRGMGRVNTRSRLYRAGADSTESILLFTKI